MLDITKKGSGNSLGMKPIEYAKLLIQTPDTPEVLPFGFRLVRNIWWNTVGTLGSQFLILTIGIVTARMLGDEAFGEFGMIRSTTSVLEIFAGASLGITATKFVAELREQDPVRTGRIISLILSVALVLGIVIMGIGILLASPLTEIALNAPHLWVDIVLATPLVLIGSMTGAITGILIGFESFKTIAQVTIFKNIIALPLTVFLIRLFGLSGAVLSLAIVGIVGLALTIRPMLKKMREASIVLKWKSALDERSVLWRFSVPAFLSSLVVNPAIWLSNIILVNQPGGYSELGLFNAAAQWRMVILLFPTIIGKVALPMLSESYGVKDRRRFSKTLWVIFGLATGGALAVAIPVIIVSPWIVTLYGSGYVGAQEILIILVFVAVVQAINSMIGHVIASVGEMWWGLFFNLLWGGLLLLFVIIWVRSYGAIGLA